VKLYTIFLLSIFSSSQVLADVIVGKWKPISGNEYREEIIENYSEDDCSQKYYWHFDADGIHTVSVPETSCIARGKRETVGPYQQKYRYKIEKDNDHFILKTAILRPNTNSDGLADIFFVKDDVLYFVKKTPWNKRKHKKQYYKRIGN